MSGPRYLLERGYDRIWRLTDRETRIVTEAFQTVAACEQTTFTECDGGIQTVVDEHAVYVESFIALDRMPGFVEQLRLESRRDVWRYVIDARLVDVVDVAPPAS